MSNGCVRRQDDGPRLPRTAERDSPVLKLRRWEEMGGVWRLASRTAAQVTVSLLRCDGGEEIERVISNDPELFAFIADRSGSDQ